MQTRSYGMWDSPITEELVVRGAIRPGNIVLDGEYIYWNELRPEESGRSVICRAGVDGERQDLTPQPYNVRTRVHEYGGGAFTVHNGVIYFVNFADQRLYCQHGDTVEPLTAEGTRFADLHVTAHGIVAIAEVDGDAEPENFLALVNPDDGAITRLAEGHDFYASPDVSGDRIAWLTWDHPDLPWNATTLWAATLSPDGLSDVQAVTDGNDESVFQPQWGPDGKLYFVSDRNEWWNFYVWDDEITSQVLGMDAEFALPQWVFRMSTWGWSGSDIICTYTQHGHWYLARLSTETGELTRIELDHNDYDQVRANDQFAAFFAAAPNESARLIRLDLKTGEETVIRKSSTATVDDGYISVAQAVSFPSTDGRTAHAFYYPPKNKDFQGPSDESPPLIVKSHGGPTAATSGSFSLKIQYWTSRGFAVLDVNYGGSTGYGRSYRNLLDNSWGIVDVEDCAKGAEYLVAKGLADPQKLAITGGSAGGFTTLACLTFTDTFCVGASHYGVSDLEALARDTHKFESRYLDRLVGPYPERKDIYEARSPVRHVDQLSCPVIFFQGLEDKIVPPNQAEAMVDALREKGIQVECITYEGEQHGFRQAANIKDCLRRELAFYRDVFDLCGV